LGRDQSAGPFALSDRAVNAFNLNLFKQPINITSQCGCNPQPQWMPWYAYTVDDPAQIGLINAHQLRQPILAQASSKDSQLQIGVDASISKCILTRIYLYVCSVPISLSANSQVSAPLSYGVAVVKPYDSWQEDATILS
jgi:hypothetical protein